MTALATEADRTNDLMAVFRFCERHDLPLPRTLTAQVPPELDDAHAGAMFARAAGALSAAKVPFTREDNDEVQRLLVKSGGEVIYHLFRYLPWSER